MNTEQVRVGVTVKTLRELRGLTQEQLAHAALLSRPFVANVEAGRKPLSDKALARVAEALRVPQAAISLVANEAAA